MAKVYVTCKQCKTKIDKIIAYSDKPRSFFCDEDCYNKYQQAHAIKHQCYHCGKTYSENIMKKVVTHWVCDKCYEKYIKTDEAQLDLFIDKIWNLYTPTFRTQNLYIVVKKQAIDFHKEYGFKYKGMSMAIDYWITTLENEWQNQYMLGQLFPKAYYLAKEHYEKQLRIKRLLKEVSINKKARVVKTNPKNICKPPLSTD